MVEKSLLKIAFQEFFVLEKENLLHIVCSAEEVLVGKRQRQRNTMGLKTKQKKTVEQS